MRVSACCLRVGTTRRHTHTCTLGHLRIQNYARRKCGIIALRNQLTIHTPRPNKAQFVCLFLRKFVWYLRNT